MVEGAALEKRCGVKATGSSNLPLSAIEKTASKGSFFYGTLGAIRTHDLRLRKPTLYPAELRVHIINCKALPVIQQLGRVTHMYRYQRSCYAQSELRVHITS